MWNWKHFAAALAVFAAGIATGFVVSAGASTDEPSQSALSAVKVEAPEPTRDGPNSVQPVSQAMPPAAHPSPIPNTSGGLAASLRSIPIPEPSRGDGTITGKITDEDGHPVAGVSLVLHPNRLDSSRHVYLQEVDDLTADPWEALETGVLELVRKRLSLRHPERTKTTGADGTFQFNGLAPEAHRLHLRHPDYRFDLSDSGRGVMPGEHLEVQAVRCVKLQIQIDAPPGTDLESCRVRVTGGQAASRSVDARRLGPGSWWCMLPPGTYAVGAYHQGLPSRSSVEIVAIAKHDQERVVRVSLEWLPTIDLSVQFIDGVPMVGPRVKLVPWEADVAIDYSSFRNVPLHSLQRVPNSNMFTCRLPNTTHGVYVVGLIVHDQLLHTERIEHRDSLSSIAIRVAAPEKQACITVLCRDQSGAVQRVKQLSISAGQHSLMDRVIAWTADDGSLLIDPRTTDDAREHLDRPIRLFVHSDKGQLKSAELEHLRPQTVDLTFALTGHVVVKLTGATVQTGPLSFDVVEDEQRWQPLRMSNQDAPSVVVLQNIPLGQSRIEARRYTTLGYLPFASVVVNVEATGSVAEMSLVPASNLTIEAPKGVSTVVLTLHSGGGPVQLQTWNPSHRREVRDLPSGNYSAEWRDPSSGAMRTKQFYLQGDTLVTLD